MIKSIVRFEFERIIKNKLFYLIGLILSIVIFIENPFVISTIYEADYVWFFINSIRMLTILSVPIIVASIFTEFKTNPLTHIIFNQPISKTDLLFGKLLSVYIVYLIWYLILSLVYSSFFLRNNNLMYGISIFKDILINYIIVIIPLLILLVLIGSAVFIEFSNIVIIYMVFSLIMLMTSYVNPILDITMKKSNYSKSLGIEDLREKIVLYNRIFMVILILFFCCVLIFKYIKKSEGINNKSLIKNKFVNDASNLLEYFFGTNKILINKAILPLIIFLVIQLVYSIYKGSYINWIRLQSFMILVPSVLVINSLSELHENKRIAYINTTNTSLYTLMEKRLVFKMLLSLTFMFIVFNIAYFTGLEYQYERMVCLIVSSCFISMVGLTVANLTKKSIYGYISSIVLWILPIVGGQRFSEYFYFLSSTLPIQVYSMILWEILFAMTAITIMLYIINLLMLTKNEMTKKYKLMYIVGGLSLMLLISIPVGKKENRYFNIDNTIITEKHEDITLHYESNIPEKYAKSVTVAFNVLKDSYIKYFDSIKDIKSIYIVQNMSDIEQTKEDLVITYTNIIELNPPKYNIGANEYIKLTKAILTKERIEKLPALVDEGLTNYLIYGIALSDLSAKVPDKYIKDNYSDLLSEDYSKYFISKIQNSDDSSDLFSDMLRETEMYIGSDKMVDFYKEISVSKYKLNQLEYIKEVILRHNPNLLSIYEKFEKLEK